MSALDHSIGLSAMEGHFSIPMDTLVPNSVEVSKEAGEHVAQNGGANKENSLLEKTPTPIYRHAAPSGPWPWMDFDEDVPIVPTSNESMVPDARRWNGYPQSLFPNWTEAQVKRCEMLTACPVGESNIFKVDVFSNGAFGEANRVAVINDEPSEAAFWDWLLGPREENIRVRAFFVENMTKQVLQMLGEKYNIEPFFFSSSTNWIPSRYQENLQPKHSDHITVVLPFIRVVDRDAVGTDPSYAQTRETGSPQSSQEDGEQMIDTQRPLYLKSCNKFILQDLLGVHMARGVNTSTIISYHPKSRKATARQLHSLINRTGRSVYWSKIFAKSNDPTCLFLCFLWYAMYQWDEVLEVLYSYINHLEQLVLNSENIRETRDLHIMQAHLLYHRTLLDDFKKSVEFVQEMENPAMQDSSVGDEQRARSKNILKIETDYLLSEIERLESQRSMQVLRMKNIMDLAFATVNIDDSRYMKELTVATVRDSAAMKQISYLTMVFLPANFMSNVFSMNVIEINPQGGETIAHYIEGAVGLTVFATWVAIALQVESNFFPPGSSVWRRVGWPVCYLWDVCRQTYRQKIDGKRKKT